MKIGVVILAAGGSRRMGEPKQLLRLDGSALIKRAVRVAVGSRASHCLVVLGHESERCAAEVHGLPVSVIVNENWQDGMGTSIRAGMVALQRDHPEVDGVIFMPCDLPFLTSRVLDELVEVHLATAAGIVACSYDGTHGIPALFHALWFQRLTQLKGGQGAKVLFDPPTDDVAFVRFPGGAIDLDTPADVALVRQEPDAP